MKFFKIFTAMLLLTSLATVSVSAEETTTAVAEVTTAATAGTVIETATTSGETTAQSGDVTTSSPAVTTGNVMITEEGEVIITRPPNYDTLTSGDFQYYLNEAGGATIIRYIGEATEVLVPESLDGHVVNNITQQAFQEAHTITDLTLPKTLDAVDELAFFGINNLLNINIDEENDYFMSENGILFDKDKTAILKYPPGRADTSFAIPDSVVFISGAAFSNASHLEEVTVPDGVYYIGKYAFAHSGIKSFDFPTAIEQIADYAFVNCKGLTEIDLPETITAIYEGTFAQCSFTEIDIPASVQEIGYGAFYECKALDTVNFAEDNQLTAILEKAFINCTQLKSVKLMGNAEIQEQAFGYVLNESNMPVVMEGFGVICQQGSRFDTYAKNNAFAVTYEGEPIVAVTTTAALTIPQAPQTTTSANTKEENGEKAMFVVIAVCGLLLIVVILTAVLGFRKKPSDDDNSDNTDDNSEDDTEDESGYNPEEEKK